jgi:hypothetical protein
MKIFVLLEFSGTLVSLWDTQGPALCAFLTHKQKYFVVPPRKSKHKPVIVRRGYQFVSVEMKACMQHSTCALRSQLCKSNVLSRVYIADMYSYYCNALCNFWLDITGNEGFVRMSLSVDREVG